MEQDQLEKKLEWLDKERRADKQTITSLKKKVTELEGLLKKSSTFAQELSTEVAKLSVLITKTDSFDQTISTHRGEVHKELEAQEKRAKSRERTVREKVDENYIQLNTELAKLRKDIEEVAALRKDILSNKQAVEDRTKAIEDLKARLDQHQTAQLESDALLRALEADQLQDKRRFTDAQGEIAALRKRIEELGVKNELLADSQRKMDAKVSEVTTSEKERREAQQAFTEKVIRTQMDVDKAFKEWSKRFETIEEQAERLFQSVQAYNEIERSLRKAQSEFEDITEQISRRIHEVTEMQRLGDERFRQEWATFRADDQKRWVNYTLTQEEQAKETTRRFDRLADRTTTLEELTQDLRDTIQHSGEQMDNLMQGLLGAFREWIAVNERYNDTLG